MVSKYALLHRRFALFFRSHIGLLYEATAQSGRAGSGEILLHSCLSTEYMDTVQMYRQDSMCQETSLDKRWNHTKQREYVPGCRSANVSS